MVYSELKRKSLVKILSGTFKDWIGEVIKYNNDKTKIKIAIYYADVEKPLMIQWESIDNLSFISE